jgi:hypothetical protein
MSTTTPTPIEITVGLNRQFIDKTGAAQLSSPNRFTRTNTTLAGLSAHIAAGYPWMPAIVDDGARRKQEHANAATVCALDIDAGMTIEQALEHPFIAAHCGLLQSSASHSAVHHKFRLVFVFPNPVEGYQNIRICNQYLAHVVGSSDRACIDASRFFYGAKGFTPSLLQDVELPTTFVDDAIAWAEAEKTAKKTRFTPPKTTVKPSASHDMDDEALLLSALDAIPPNCEYNGWIAVGMALHEILGESGFNVWDGWSSRASNYDAGQMASKWRSFDGREGDPATIFGIAKAHGWKQPKQPRYFNHKTPPRTNAGAEDGGSCDDEKSQNFGYYARGKEADGFPLNVKEWDDKSKRPVDVKLPSHGAIAQYFLGKYEGRIGRVNDDLYLFSPVSGLAEKLGREDLLTLIRDELKTCVADMRGRVGPSILWPMVDEASHGWKDLCGKDIRATAPKIRLDSPNGPLIPLANGVLNLETRVLTTFAEEADRGNLFSYKAAVWYSPLQLAPRWLQYLAECVDPRDVELLQAVTFATIAGRYDLKFNVELVGGRDCGKSVTQRLIAACFGAKQSPVVAPVSFRKLLNPEKQFATMTAVGKKLITVADTKGFVGSSEVFKQMTSGGDSLEAEGKGRDSTGFVFEGIIWTAGNDVIRFSDDDDATRSRRLIIRFPHTITADKQEPLLSWDKDGITPTGAFAPELAGILNWALLASATAETTIKTAKEAASNNADLASVGQPLAQWVNQCVALGSGFSETIGQANTAGSLYESYFNWCHGNNVKPVGTDKFTPQFLEYTTKFQSIVPVEKVHLVQKRVNIITGVGLIYKREQLDEFVLNGGRDVQGNWLVPREPEVANPELDDVVIDVDPELTHGAGLEAAFELDPLATQQLTPIEPPPITPDWVPSIGDRVAVLRDAGWVVAELLAIPRNDKNGANRTSFFKVAFLNGDVAHIWKITDLRLLESQRVMVAA